jgi:hypothetical protein
MKTFEFVAPAKNAPSGVKAIATTADPIVIEYLGLVAGDRAFQILIAPSSPAETSILSVSSFRLKGEGIGCHISDVINPW